jgi:FixJ family two-component response regulator
MDASGQAIVYIVDDDVNVRQSERSLLETKKIRVLDFPSAEVFLKQADFEVDAAQCLLLDLRLPGMDGLELQQELLRRRIQLPIIVQTGFPDLLPAVKALKAGAVEILEKPFAAGEFFDCVLKALAQDQARRNREKDRRTFHEVLAKLSPRERQVMDGLVAGSSVKELAATMKIGTQTVLKHRASLLKKLGAKNEVQLIMLLAAYDLAQSSAARTALVKTSLENGLLSNGVSSVPSDDSSVS